MPKIPSFKYKDSKTRWQQGFADGVRNRPFRYGKRRHRLAANKTGLSTSSVLYWVDYESGYRAGRLERERSTPTVTTLWSCRVCWCITAFVFVSLLLLSLLE